MNLSSRSATTGCECLKDATFGTMKRSMNAWGYAPEKKPYPHRKTFLASGLGKSVGEGDGHTVKPKYEYHYKY